MLISVVIRTLNESKHLNELLTAIESQILERCDREVIVVDSGSDDGTLAIARDFDNMELTVRAEFVHFG